MVYFGKSGLSVIYLLANLPPHRGRRRRRLPLGTSDLASQGNACRCFTPAPARPPTDLYAALWLAPVIRRSRGLACRSHLHAQVVNKALSLDR